MGNIGTVIDSIIGGINQIINGLIAGTIDATIQIANLIVNDDNNKLSYIHDNSSYAIGTYNAYSS